MPKQPDYRELAEELRALAEWAWREADRALLCRTAAEYEGLALEKRTPSPGDSRS